MSELRVLGSPELVRDDEPLTVGGPKAQILLSILVAQRADRMSTDRLIEGVWGDDAPPSAAATIQSQISRLRASLRPDFAIDFESGGYRLELLDGAVDADRFGALLTRSQAVDADASVELLEAALALWHGAAFGPFADVADVHGEALRLDELRLVATDAWAEARMATGDPALMVAELEALVSDHPLRECYRRLLMLALYRTGRQAEALRRSEEFRRILGDEVGLDLSPGLRELEAGILADDPDLMPTPPSSGGRHSTTVSVAQLRGTASFIGRDPSLASVSGALSENPVVTITGPGGVGKTRLARRVAADLLDQFEDGIAVVELAALQDPSGTAQLIAHALDVQQRQHRTIEDTIVEYLAPSTSLLLLDNCEHVVDEIAPLVDRLRSACPMLRILATSRQSLGLAGEYVEVLVPLSLPPPDAELADEIGRSDAVELFVTRAASATPGFTLTDENAPAVSDICRRLDGLPLALELAAARLRTMGLDTLATRLGQRIELDGQTQRGADGRQRTLDDLIRWSHDLLAPQERRVFEQLAVFAGGFDLAAAEFVYAIERDETSVVGHLTSLVDKSMVVLVDPGASRFRLLEPLREFGRDRLRHRDALDRAEGRHLRWFMDLAEQGSLGLDSLDEASWSADLDREHDNLRAAFRTAVRRDDSDAALRLVAALREFAFRRVKYEITTWADTATSLPGAEDHPQYPTALAVSAYGRFVRGDMPSAIELAREALRSGGPPDISESGLPERVLGNAYFYREQTDEALEWMDHMLLSARRSGSTCRVTHGLYMRSVAETSLGDEIRGAVLAGEARAAADSPSSPTARAQADYALGLALEATEPDEALALLERAGVVGARAGNRWIEAFALTEVHSLQAKRGEHLIALAGFGDVVDIWFRGGDWANQWLSLRHVLGVLVEMEALEAAAVLHGALTAVGAAQALPFVPADAVHLSEGMDQARSRLGEAEFADAVRRGASMVDREIVSFVRAQIAEMTADPTG